MYSVLGTVMNADFINIFILFFLILHPFTLSYSHWATGTPVQSLIAYTCITLIA